MFLLYKTYYEDVYKLLLTDYSVELFFIGSFGLFHGLEILTQNKKGLLFRLNYLSDKGYIAEDKAMLGELQRLCVLIDHNRKNLSKYYYSKDKVLLESIRESFIECEGLEIEVLERVKELIAEALNGRL